MDLFSLWVLFILTCYLFIKFWISFFCYKLYRYFYRNELFATPKFEYFFVGRIVSRIENLDCPPIILNPQIHPIRSVNVLSTIYKFLRKQHLFWKYRLSVSLQGVKISVCSVLLCSQFIVDKSMIYTKFLLISCEKDNCDTTLLNQMRSMLRSNEIWMRI